MPYKPKRPCAYPGCGRLAESEQYCAEHQKVVTKQYNQYERDPASNKRYGRAWKRIRDRYIKAHPLCEECEKQDRLTPAEEVHHILSFYLKKNTYPINWICSNTKSTCLTIFCNILLSYCTSSFICACSIIKHRKP